MNFLLLSSYAKEVEYELHRFAFLVVLSGEVFQLCDDMLLLLFHTCDLIFCITSPEDFAINVLRKICGRFERSDYHFICLALKLLQEDLYSPIQHVFALDRVLE